ncbi:MAG: hypothetical protein IJV84_00635 [Bacteroidales bacterium]|nr:hypothetical protein [Bacteroidales bacterium]
MKRVMSVVVILLSLRGLSAAQDNISVIMQFLGADSPEDVDEYETERLSAMISRPLRINSVTFSRLASSGLFTAYQTASLLEYRARHGDVMSLTELSSVDGFSEEFVTKIGPFITLEGGEVGESDDYGLWHDLSFRTGVKDVEDEYAWNYGIKYSIETGSGISAGMSLSKSNASSGALPDSFSGSVEWEGKRLPLRLIAGDYNSRFGQGLALWNGMSISGLATPSAFMRRPSGYSRSSSFTGSYAMTGLALSACIGKFVLNTSVALPGIRSVRQSQEDLSVLPVLNLVWNHHNGQIGMTHYVDSRPWNREIDDFKSSIDFAWCIRGVDVFAEAAFDWIAGIPAALAGVSVPIGEAFRSSAMIRLYPSEYSSVWSAAQRSTAKCSNELAVSAAFEYSSGDRVNKLSFAADAAYFPEPKDKTSMNNRQIKIHAMWERNGEFLALKIRFKERARDWGRHYQTDLRLDLTFRSNAWSLGSRINMLYCKSLAGLGFIEGQYAADKTGFYLKTGIFIVDNWDDRIYSYERDVPGTFNVPAFYGRGMWVSALASWRFTRWGKLYLRASYTGYPLMPEEKKKPGKAELRLQCMVTF